jgi:hypothetical protein
MEFVHIQCVAKKLTRVLKILCYNPRKWPETDIFVRTHMQTLLARRHTLVLLCIKLCLVHGGGTVGVKKCIILASVWESNFWFQRHLNGPKTAHNVYLTVQKSMKTTSNVFYKESVHIQDVAIKLTRVLKIMCYNQRKWPETDVFTKTHLQTLLARRHTPGAVMH